MSEAKHDLGIVGETIRDLLSTVNAGFNWEIVKRRYDNNPAGTAMSLHFTDDDGETPVEEIYLGIAEGPELVLLDGISEQWDYIGAIVMQQDYGLRILDPDDKMTPQIARYKAGGVSIQAPEGKSRERTWYVTSRVLDIILESIIHQNGNPNSGGGA